MAYKELEGTGYFSGRRAACVEITHMCAGAHSINFPILLRIYLGHEKGFGCSKAQS